MAIVVIEDLDAFKAWLTKTLTPICDADPQALAKYVIALIKKEKTAEELKPVCLNQLDVFLQEKTKDFVDTLFLSLKNKTYMPPPPAIEPKPPVPDVSEKENSTVPEKRKSVSDKDSVRSSDANNDRPNRRREDVRNRLGPGPDNRRRSRSPGRPRSRSPGWVPRNRSPFGERPPLRERERSPLRDRSPLRERSPARRRNVFDRLDRRRSPPGRGGRRFGMGRGDARRRRPSPPRSPGQPRRTPLRRSRSPRPHSPRQRSLDRPRSTSPNSRRVPVERNRSLSPMDKAPRERSPLRRFRSWSMSSDGLSSVEGSPRRSKSPAKTNGSNCGGKTPDSRGSTPRDYSPYNREKHDAREYVAKPSAKPRCRDYDEKGYCMRGDMCPYDHGADPVVVDDVSLPSVLQLNQHGGPNRTFQRPSDPTQMPGGPPGMARPPLPPPTSMAYPGPRGGPPIHRMPGPMRGPMPPSMPMGVRDGPPPPLMSTGYPMRPGMHANPPPPGTVPVHVPMVSQGYAHNLPPTSQPPPYGEYNPEAPGIISSQGYIPTKGIGHPPISAAMDGISVAVTAGGGRRVQGNIVSINTQQPIAVTTVTEPESQVSASNRTVLLGKRQMEDRPFSQNGSYMYPPSKRPFFNQYGQRKPFKPNNTSLEIRKIPVHENNIGSLNAHFTKFGLIKNLQVFYNGDPQAAVITFATPAQATAAYKCTEPVFNNRLIKILWHNPENFSPASGEETNSGRPSVKERLGSVSIPPANKLSLSNVKQTPQPKPSVITPTGLSKTVFNPDATKPTNPGENTVHKAQQLKQQEAEIAKKKLDIQRKRQALLQEQLAQQKVLITKLEGNKNMSPEDKKSILKTIKILADSIEKLKTELVAKTQSAQKQAKPQSATSQQQQKTQANAPSTPQATNTLVKQSTTPTEPSKGEKSPVVGKTTEAALKLNVTVAQAANTVQSPPALKSPKEKAIEYLKHKEKTQLEILDTELDIISKENSGSDTSALRLKVAELKRQAAALGLLGPGMEGGRGRGLASRGGLRGGPGGRGGYRGRGARGGGSNVLDRRPKQLHVSHYAPEEKEEVVAHLSSFGAIESIVHDDTVPSMMIDFATRHDAEQAARDGQAFKKKRLVMAWGSATTTTPSPKTLPVRRPSVNPTSSAPVESTRAVDPDLAELDVDTTATSLDDADLDGIDEDTLLGLDEEEEDEDGDKSWKR